MQLSLKKTRMNKLISFKFWLRKLINHFWILRKAIIPFKMMYHFIFRYLVSDKFYYQEKFSETMGYYFDFKNPKTLNEKIQLLKLYDRSNLHTQCADKINVRKYVSEIIGDKVLVPVLLSTKNVNDINQNTLPNDPFIIKATHDSGSTLIINDKNTHDFSLIRSQIRHWLKRNYYNYSKEWQYKNIQPAIIVEKLLLTSNNKIPSDIKAHCINGKVEFFQVDCNRGTDEHYRDFYLKNWEKAPFTWNENKTKEEKLKSSDLYYKKPEFLDDLIIFSEKLSAKFAYVRVDWYDCGDEFYFGELTFHHDSGYVPILPKEWDLLFGEKLILKYLQ